MLSFEEFKDYYYKTKYFPLGIINYNKDKKLNEGQLKNKYNKYIKLLDKNNKINYYKNKKEIDINILVRKRDNNKCRFINILTLKEYNEFKKNVSLQLLEIIDVAHIFRRSESLKLKENIDNLICLNRYSHQALDSYKSPINNNISITKEEQIIWWKRIIGKELYLKLEELYFE